MLAYVSERTRMSGVGLGLMHLFIGCLPRQPVAGWLFSVAPTGGHASSTTQAPPAERISCHWSSDEQALEAQLAEAALLRHALLAHLRAGLGAQRCRFGGGSRAAGGTRRVWPSCGCT